MEHMPRSVARWIGSLADATDKEICGFVHEDWTFTQIENVSDDPHHAFTMEPTRQRETVNASLLGLVSPIIGIFHSHPADTDMPSESDLLGWPRDRDAKYEARYWIFGDGWVREYHDNCTKQFYKDGDGRIIVERIMDYDVTVAWEYTWGSKESLAQPIPINRKQGRS